MDEIKFAKMRPDAKLPSRKHEQDAGIDLYAVEIGVVPPHGFAVIGTGICFDLPRGFAGLLFPKSRSNFLLGAGVIDAGYQGEIRVKVANPTAEPLVFEPGDALAQLIIVPIVTPAVAEASIETIYPARSERGASGGIHLPVP